MNRLFSFTRTVCKIVKVILIAVAILCAICALLSAVALNQSVVDKIKELVSNGAISISSNNLLAATTTITNLKIIAVLTFASGIVVCVLEALIFNNIVCVIDNTELTRTPFVKENAELIEKIGKFAIASPIIDLVFNAVAGYFSNGSIKLSLDITSLLMGLVVLCLARFFEYGVSLEAERKQ